MPSPTSLKTPSREGAKLVHSIWDFQLLLLVPTVALAHVFLAPHTKVEESFNIQALHDWIFLGPSRIGEWDHILFPGAVPRSFIPSSLLAVSSYPILLALKVVGFIQTSADVQLALRSVLALTWSAALLFFIHRISTSIDVSFFSAKLAEQDRLRRWIWRSFVITSVVQFRLPFYAGRTLPNALAMPLVLTALALILPRGLDRERNQLVGISILVFSAVIYRLELLGLLAASGFYLLHSILTRHREDYDPHPIEHIAKLAGVTQASLTLSALLSTGVDTWFWKASSATSNWILPEIEALKFNVVEGKSEEWGISPWYFYLTSAVPGLLLATAPLALAGVVSGFFAAFRKRPTNAKPTSATTSEPPNRELTKGQPHKNTVNLFRKSQSERSDAEAIPPLAFAWLSLAHIGLLSCLAHKEWRFVIYTAPLLNVLGALFAAQCLARPIPVAAERRSSFSWKLGKAICAAIPLACWALTLSLTIVSTFISRGNYPGGEALSWLHRTLHADTAVLHIDVPPAMTGVTLFQSIHLPSHHRSGEASSFGLSWLPSVLPRGNVTAGSVVEATWAYDKSEDLIPLGDDGAPWDSRWSSFDYLVSGQPCRHRRFNPLPFEKHEGVMALLKKTEPAVFAEYGRIFIHHGSGGEEPAFTVLASFAGYALGTITDTLTDADSGEIIAFRQGLALTRLADSRKTGTIVAAAGFDFHPRVYICKRQAL